MNTTKISLRRVLAAASLVSFLAVSLVGAVRGAEKPNIVWMMAEDMGPDLSCYGNGAVHTPVIDKLASEGARYLQAFTTSPVCSSIMRSSIRTRKTYNNPKLTR